MPLPLTCFGASWVDAAVHVTHLLWGSMGGRCCTCHSHHTHTVYFNSSFPGSVEPLKYFFEIMLRGGDTGFRISYSSRFFRIFLGGWKTSSTSRKIGRTAPVTPFTCLPPPPSRYEDGGLCAPRVGLGSHCGAAAGTALHPWTGLQQHNIPH